MSNRTREIPSDEKAEAAYAQCMAIAEAAGILHFAYSGVATIAIPREQRKAGIREDVLYAGLFKVEQLP